MAWSIAYLFLRPFLVLKHKLCWFDPASPLQDLALGESWGREAMLSQGMTSVVSLEKEASVGSPGMVTFESQERVASVVSRGREAVSRGREALVGSREMVAFVSRERVSSVRSRGREALVGSQGMVAFGSQERVSSVVSRGREALVGSQGMVPFGSRVSSVVSQEMVALSWILAFFFWGGTSRFLALDISLARQLDSAQFWWETSMNL